MSKPFKSTSGNWVLPNTFQTPNFLVDQLMFYLTSPETVVLLYAIRQILGYQDKIEMRRARISLSRFAHCGLGQQAIRSAIKGLGEYKILEAVGEPTEDGQMYELQQNEDEIDWDGLTKRREEKETQQSSRTSKATSASLEARGITSDDRGNVGRNTPPTSDVTGGVTSDVDNKTNPINPPSNPKDSGAEAPSAPKGKKTHERDTRLDHPAILLVRGVTNAYPPKASFAFVIDKLGDTPDGPKFATAYQTWCTRGNKPTNLEGVIDWYINGVPPQYKPAYGKAGTPAPANQPEVDYTDEREAIKKATIAKRLAAREGHNANAQASPR
jgi:hypothetical protein